MDWHRKVNPVRTNAFGYCSNLTILTIGTNVTSIDDEAFYNCTKLTGVTIPQSVASIGAEAFGSCTRLTGMTIPSAVTNIGTGVFSNCPSLMAITVDKLNPVYSSFDGVLFNQVQTTLIQSPQGIVGAFVIPSGITTIMDQAFQYCSGLTSVTIPDTITSIGDQAFQYCGSLTSITIPDSVTNIGNSTFEYCTNLTSTTIGTNVTSIGDLDFSYDANLVTVTFPDGLTTIGDLSFNGCTSLSSAAIPDSVTTIGGWAFSGCGITNLKIGNGVTSIGQRAFLGLTSLATSVTIPSTVTNIGDYGFAVDWRVKAFFFQGNAPNIGPNTFWDDFNQTVYYLPGTTGWTNFAQLAGIPTVLWNPQAQTTDASFGVQSNQFGFNITGTANIPIVVEANTNLTQPSWTMLFNGTVTNGMVYFSDPQWVNYPDRFYRITSP
jgi:hypothetical protein